MNRRLLPGGVAGSLVEAWPALALFLAQRVVSLVVYVGVVGELSIRGLLRWDAGWYTQVAVDGYDTWPEYGASGERVPTNLAFFPLFPMAGRLLGAVTPLEPGGSLVLLAWVGSLVAAWGVFAVGNHLAGRAAGTALVLAWGASPQATVLVMGYPEGWLTAAIAFALLFVLTDRPVAAGLVCLVAGLLHPTSLPLIGIVGLWALSRGVQSIRAEGWRPSGWRRYALGAVLAPLGMVGVLVGIAVRTGRVLGYFDVQADWGSEMGSPLTFLTTMHDRVFHRAGGGSLSAVYAPIIIGYVILLALLLGQLRQGLPRSFAWLVAYTVLSSLLVFANQDYFNSIPRHLLPVFTLLLPLARLRSNRIGAALALIVASAASAWWGANFILISAESI